MTLRATIDIDVPVSDVFRFYADDHVQNHPRWDPDVELEATSDEPLGVGSVIKRHITRLGRVTDGEMTITQFDRNEVFAVEIHDGPNTMHGRTTFTEIGPEKTRLLVEVEAPNITDPAMRDAVERLMQRSLDNIKGMMETH